MPTVPEIKFDHFAYPIEDLVRAEDFYTNVLEIPIFERRGLRVVDVQAGTLPRTFLDIAGHRVGIFLGREPLPEEPELHGCPRVGLEVTADGLKRIAGRLKDQAGINFEGPRPRTGLGPKAASILLQDPFGNRLELLEKDAPPVQKNSLFLGLSHLELEVTDLDRSTDFYAETLGLEIVGREEDFRGKPTMVLQTPSRQWLMLHEVAALSPRSSAFYRFEGQHYAFLTPTVESLADIREVIAKKGGQLDALEQTQVRSQSAHGLYFTDFDGNPMQLQVAGYE